MSRMTGASRGPGLGVFNGDSVGLDRRHFSASLRGRAAAVERARHAAPTADVHHSAERAHEPAGQELRAAGQGAIGEAGDANRFAFEAGRAAELRHLLRRHGHRRGNRLPEFRPANHRRVGQARTKRRRGHAGPVQLLGERLRQRQNIGLGGGVGRNSRDRHERKDRGDIENAAAAARDHRGQNKVGQRRQRNDIDLQEPQVAFERDARKVALEGDACIVDQDLDRDARPGERVDHRLRRAGEAEIDRHRLRLHGVSRHEFSRERRQRLLVAGRQNKIETAGREGPRKFPADPGGGARDENPSRRPVDLADVCFRLLRQTPLPRRKHGSQTHNQPSP